MPPASLLAEASTKAVPEPKVESVSKPEVAKKQAVEKETPTVKAAAAPGTKGRPPPPSKPHPSVDRPPVPDVPPEFKDKVVPKAIVAPKRAASSSSGRSESKKRWGGARKRREVTTEEIKELSDKIEKYVSGSSPVAQSSETHVSMEVDESSNVPEVTKTLDDVVLDAGDTSGDAEMKESDPNAADLGEAIVKHVIDVFGAAIAGDI